MARPSTYNPRYHVPWVLGLSRRGLTLDEIAEEIGIARSTLCQWLKKYPELADAQKEGKGIADSHVEDSLYRRALGYKTVEKKTSVATREDGTTYPAKVEIVEKELPPDTVACIFWLKNRNPKAWRDNPDLYAGEDKPVINLRLEGLVDGN